MTRHAAIIQKLGGHVYLASLFGLHVETTKSWLKHDRGIPPRYWHRISAISPDLTPEYLERTKPGAVPLKRLPRRYRAAAE